MNFNLIYTKESHKGIFVYRGDFFFLEIGGGEGGVGLYLFPRRDKELGY